MRIARTLVFIVVAVLCLAPRAFARDDVEGAKDHPLVSRMPGYYINFINAFQKIGGQAVNQATSDLCMKVEKGGGVGPL